MELTLKALLSPPNLPTPLCPGPDAEEEPCLLPGCDRESSGAQDSAFHSPWMPAALPQLAPSPCKTRCPLQLLPFLCRHTRSWGLGSLGALVQL